jgi:glycosyltransferase involved in cell wall biosynthesis
MKIVQYLSEIRLELGGAARAVLDLCTALAERGHEVTQLTCDPADVPGSWVSGEPGHPRVERMERRARPLPRLSSASALKAAGEIERADVVHLHVPWDPICLQLGRMARRAGVPYVVAIHGMLDDWSMSQKGLKKRLYLALGGRRLLQEAAAVHCTAEAERDQSSKWYPRGRPVVVPLIFDVSEYEELPGPEVARREFASAFGDPGQAVLLFLSRLHPKKRPELLIEAAGQLRDEGVALKLLVVGSGEPGYERGLRRLVGRLGLDGQVEFLGFVSGRNKVSLYQSADLLVLPTSQENWGFVLIESLACGTPVVTTRGVDIWPELQSSGGAMIVDPTPSAIAAAVAGLIQDEERRRAMQRRGRAWVLKELNVDRVVARYEELYDGLSRSSGRRSPR